MRNPYNILRHELIGIEVEILPLMGESYKGHGKIYKETKNTILIKDQDKIKTFPKNSIILIAKLDDECIVKINGNLLVGRAEERIKKKYKIFFKF